MSYLMLVKGKMFGDIPCDCYKDRNDDIWITGEQIGRALEYTDPTTAIYKIHTRHKDRLDQFSVLTKLVASDGKAYNTNTYNSKGIYEICRWSRQPKADAFFDWVWNLLDDLRSGKLKLLEQDSANYHQLTSATNCLSMLEVAKSIKICGRNSLFKILREENILMSNKNRKNIPYERYITAGYFTVVMTTIIKNGKAEDLAVCMVTPKGINYILNLVRKKGLLKVPSIKITH